MRLIERPFFANWVDRRFGREAFIIEGRLLHSVAIMRGSLPGGQTTLVSIFKPLTFQLSPKDFPGSQRTATASQEEIKLQTLVLALAASWAGLQLVLVLARPRMPSDLEGDGKLPNRTISDVSTAIGQERVLPHTCRVPPGP